MLQIHSWLVSSFVNKLIKKQWTGVCYYYIYIYFLFFLFFLFFIFLTQYQFIYMLFHRGVYLTKLILNYLAYCLQNYAKKLMFHLRMFARKSSNTARIFFKLLPQLDNELLMSEMQNNWGTPT